MKKQDSSLRSSTLLAALEGRFRAAFKVAFDQESSAEVTPATQERFGDYQYNSAIRLGKLLGKPPREVAQKIIDALDNSDHFIDNLEIAGPGFINITLNADHLAKRVGVMAGDDRLAVPLASPGQRVICEFSSPNIAKAMHVGHLRSTIIGESIARLLEFLGHDVIRLNHVGDWGTQFGMLIAYLKIFHPAAIEEGDKSTLEQLMSWYRESKKHFDESASFKKEAQEEVVKLQSGNPDSKRAWQRICEISRCDFQKLYQILDVRLEERGESFYNPILSTVVQDCEAAGLVEVDGGAKCIFLEGFKNKEGDLLPLIVQKSDGGFNYATTDMAAFKYRAQVDRADRIIVITDAGQSQHFQMVHGAAVKVGYVTEEYPRFDHVTFGVVLAPDGTKFRTRSGEVEGLKTLLDEAVVQARALLADRTVDDLEEAARIIGLGAVKYADLSCNRNKDYTFSYERMLRFEGNTAAFILYAYVRICSIERKIGKDRLQTNSTIALEHPTERALALHLCRFPEALAIMDEELLPSRLTDYLFHLAEKFHAFFRDCHVEGDSHQASRLLLIHTTARTIRQGLHLLGIGVVDRM